MEKREDMPKVDPNSVPEMDEVRKIEEVPDPNIDRNKKKDNPSSINTILTRSGQVIYQ